MTSPRASRPAGDPPREALLARLIGRSRLVVMVAVVAVLAAAFSFFLLGAVLAAQGIIDAWRGAIVGHIDSTELTLQFLQIVTVMLKAVFFYLVGVGLYSLFISPLNLTVALGVKTLSDLEAKIISVVIVIMAVSFMEHYIESRGDMAVLLSSGALALAVIALVAFQWHAHRAGQDHSDQRPGETERARHEMFEQQHEQHEVEQPPPGERRPRKSHDAQDARDAQDPRDAR